MNPLDYIAKSPGRRAFVLSGLAILGNVISGAFIASISSESGIDWISSFKSVYFYALVLVILIMAGVTYKVHKMDLRHAEEVDAYNYVKTKCLDDMAIKCSQLIRDGDFDQFFTQIERLK